MHRCIANSTNVHTNTVPSAESQKNRFAFISFRVHNQALSIRSHRGTKVVWLDFQPMRVPEEPVCIHLFRQNPVFISCIWDITFMSYRLWRHCIGRYSGAGGIALTSTLHYNGIQVGLQHISFSLLKCRNLFFRLCTWPSWVQSTCVCCGAWWCPSSSPPLSPPSANPASPNPRRWRGVPASTTWVGLRGLQQHPEVVF